MPNVKKGDAPTARTARASVLSETRKGTNMKSIASDVSQINDSTRAITHAGLPVVTSDLLAHFYETDVENIKKNFGRNRDRFVEGKHYFKLEGLGLKEFKHKVTNCPFVKIAPNVRHLALWTERGAARHAKMLETNRAWDVFEQLEDFYFSQKDTRQHQGDNNNKESTTVDDRTPLRGVVNRIMGKYGMTYQSVYKIVHEQFGVRHIDELSPRRMAEAIEYLAVKAIDGEFIGKSHTVAPILSYTDIAKLTWLWDYANRSQALFKELYPAMDGIKSSHAGSVYDLAFEFRSTIALARGVVSSLSQHVEISEAGDDINPAALLRLRSNSLPTRYR